MRYCFDIKFATRCKFAYQISSREKAVDMDKKLRYGKPYPQAVLHVTEFIT
jgi:hypothetical protein